MISSTAPSALQAPVSIESTPDAGGSNFEAETCSQVGST